MTPSFAEAVDQVFVAVLELLERIALGEDPSASKERMNMKRWISRAEALLKDRKEEWRLAKYALVCWIDTQLTSAPWAGKDYWDDNVLERELFGYRHAFTEFFQEAKAASQLSKKNALEVYYLCVVLGFRGLYGISPENRADGERPEDLHLPPDIETWAKEVYSQLNITMARAPLEFEPRPLEVATPLRGKRMMILSCTVAAMMAAVPTGLLIWYLMTM